MTTDTAIKATTTTTTTTIEREGPGQVTLADFIEFAAAANTAGIPGDTPVEVEQEQHYDAEARKLVCESWVIKATGTVTS